MGTPKALSGAELAHFNAFPWAQSILQSSLQQNGQNNSDYVAIEMPARTLKPPTDEDGYFGGTLATPTTIPHIVTLRRRNLQSVSPLPAEPPVIDAKSSQAFAPSRPPDTLTLISLSAPGLSGHTSTVHGGVVATLFDEAMYLAVEAYLLSSSSSSSPPSSSRERDKIYTAQLNVRYREPVSVPGLLVVRSWCVAHAGRKYWTVAQAVQEEEDPDRKAVRAEASSLWVVTRDEKL
jgi:acyl-coenzyme A thioesterase PaaI-like protein